MARKINTGIGSTLPTATLAQRINALSTPQLLAAARALAPKTDGASDQACTAILEAIEKRIGGLTPAFEAFVAEIYA